MTQNSAPWDGVTVGDAATAPYDANEWSLFQSKFLGYGASRAEYGIIKGNSAAPASTVTFYGLDVRATAPASTNVTLKSGTAVVTGTLYENDADLALVVQPNASGNARIDSVILRKDYVAKTVRAVIRQGTPAATPVPPTLTQSTVTEWEIAIADIAVANGFSTITQADIIPRQAFANIPDTVVLDRIRNNSGGELVTGDVVIWDDIGTISGTQRASVTTTTTANHPRVAGAWIGRTASGGYGRLLVKGIGLVNVSTADALSAPALVVSSVAKRAESAAVNFPGMNVLGFAFEQGSGLRYAYIDCNMRNTFGYGKFSDQKAQNTAGGTFTNGAWRTRDLNAGSSGQFQFAFTSLAANVITLTKPGLYLIRASAPAFNVDGHQTRLNINAGSSFVEGTTEHAPTGVQSRSFVTAQINSTSAGSSVSLEHRCVTTRATDGFGKAANLTGEIYSVVEIWRQELALG